MNKSLQNQNNDTKIGHAQIGALLKSALVMFVFLNDSSARGSSGAPQASGAYQIRIVPDTVDLARNAEFAVNAITRTTNPKQKYDTYFIGDITSNPPRLVGPAHIHGKFWETLALPRLMTGNKAGTDVDDAWATRLPEISKALKTDTVNGGRILAMLALYSGSLAIPSGWAMEIESWTIGQHRSLNTMTSPSRLLGIMQLMPQVRPS